MVVCQYFLKGNCRYGDRCRDEHPTAKRKTVCQHFLKGYCRFGDKCWNEHPSGGGGGGGFGQQQRSAYGGSGQWNRSTYQNHQNRFEALSTGSRDKFGAVHSNDADSEQTISQIKKTIENDMEIWGNSKQWPLSCYTYTKGEPCLQGLLDFSAEEIRLEAYKANSEGKGDTYQQGLKRLTSVNQQRRLQLSQMSVAQIQQEIKQQTKLPSSEAMEAGTSIFQQTNTGGGMFGSSGSLGQSQGGLGGSFGGESSFLHSSGFSTVSGSSSQSGLLGTASTNNQSGVFGQSSVSGVTGSVFGNNANSTNQTTGMTGLTSTFTANNQSGGLFGASSGLSAGLFAGVKTELNPGLFGSSPPTTSSGLFSSGAQVQKESSIISTSQASHNTMGSTSLPSKTPSTGTTTATTTPAAAPVSLGCSDEDMQAFRADSFVLGKIPECPPPLELC